MTVKDKHIVIVGGSSGIGLATAKLAIKAGAKVSIASRSLDKLNRAKQKLDNKVNILQVDILDINSVQNLFNMIGSFDHLQLPASNLVSGPFLSTSTETARQSFDSKFWGPYEAAKAAYEYIDKSQGSITFFSGSYSQRPTYPGAAIAAAINSAVEGLARALACELAPVRVNVVSPGLTMTERFTENYTEVKLQELSQNFCQQLVIQRPAKPDEVANTALHLMENTYMTGNTVFVDGGLSLR